jgi:hypothetical protein
MSYRRILRLDWSVTLVLQLIASTQAPAMPRIYATHVLLFPTTVQRASPQMGARRPYSSSSGPATSETICSSPDHNSMCVQADATPVEFSGNDGGVGGMICAV